MNNLKSFNGLKLKILITLIIAFALCITGYLIANKTEEKPVLAFSTSAGDSFDLYNGLDIVVSGAKGGVYLSVTEEQKTKLLEPTKHQSHLFGAYYRDFLNEYNIALFRVKDTSKIEPFFHTTELTLKKISELSESFNDGEFIHLYHYYQAGQYSFEKMNLVSEESNMSGYFFLPFNMSLDFSTEYKYIAVFVERDDIINLWGDVIEYATYYTFGTQTSTLTRSASSVASSYLASTDFNPEDWTEEELRQLQCIAGLTSTESNFTVNVISKNFISYGNVENKVESYQVDSLYSLSPSWVWASVLTLSGKSSIYDFNCISSNGYYLQGVEYITDSRILYQAKDYVYSFDFSSNVGTLEIIYSDFQFKDFAIMVKDNDTSDLNNLTSYIYFTDISYNQDTDIIVMTLPIVGESGTSVGLKNLLFNSLGWIVDEFSAEHFSVSAPSDIDVSITNENITISFDKDNEPSLANLYISATAEIIPDYECTININYVELSYVDGNIIANSLTKTDTVMYSVYSRDYVNSSAFRNMYGEMIDSALVLDILDGQDFYLYHGITSSKDGESTFSVNVDYTYNTLLKVITNITHHIKFYALTKNSLIYYANEFDFAIPEGYQLESLTTPDTNDLSINFNGERPDESTITVKTNTKQNKVLTLTANLMEIPEPPEETTPTEPDDGSSGDNDIGNDNGSDGGNIEPLPDETPSKDEEPNVVIDSDIIIKVIVCLAVALILIVLVSVAISTKSKK